MTTEYKPKHPLTNLLLRENAFRECPLRVLDIGARGGAERIWQQYDDQIDLIGFEPDPEECEAINRSKNSRLIGINQTFYSVALSNNKGVNTLYITKDPNNSSILQPNLGLRRRYHGSEDYEVVKEVEVKTTDLNSFAADQDWKYIDFMKLDAQGSELAILKGASSMLKDSVLGLSVEVEFLQAYTDQPLFAELDSYIQELGYRLYDIEISRWRRKTLGSGNDPNGKQGQIAWGQAIYLRDLPTDLDNGRQGDTGSQYDLTRTLKLASLAEVYGFSDYAIECLESAHRAGLIPSDQTIYYSNLLRSENTDSGYHPQIAPLRAPIGLTKTLSRRLIPRSLRSQFKRILIRLVSE